MYGSASDEAGVKELPRSGALFINSSLWTGTHEEQVPSVAKVMPFFEAQTDYYHF